MRISCFLLDFMSWSAHDKHLQDNCMLKLYCQTRGNWLLLLITTRITAHLPSCCRFAQGKSKNCPKKNSFCTHRGLSQSLSISILHPTFILSAAPKLLFAKSPNSGICLGYGKGGATKKTMMLGKCFGEVGGWHSWQIFFFACFGSPSPYHLTTLPKYSIEIVYWSQGTNSIKQRSVEEGCYGCQSFNCIFCLCGLAVSVQLQTSRSSREDWWGKGANEEVKTKYHKTGNAEKLGAHSVDFRVLNTALETLVKQWRYASWGVWGLHLIHLKSRSSYYILIHRLHRSS